MRARKKRNKDNDVYASYRKVSSHVNFWYNKYFVTVSKRSPFEKGK